MFKFLLPKQFFIKEKKIHKNIFEKNKGFVYEFGRFDSGNIIINYNYEIVVLDKNFEILYKENIGVIHYLTIINNDQFIGIKDDEMCLFSFVYSNYINSDNPSEPLNQKKIIKIVSEQFFKINIYDIVEFFYDKNNNKIYLAQCNGVNSNDVIHNYYILIFDVFKNKITLKTKLTLFYNDICELQSIIFKNKYLIVSKKLSIRVFRANNMKEIFPGINNLKLYSLDYIENLMNLNNEFLLIATGNKLIKYDFYKREIIYSCDYYLPGRKRFITTKNYLFLYGIKKGAIIFDKKTIRPIQSKHILNIFFIDEISDENIKFTTACYNIFCDKSQTIKIYLFSCVRVFSFFLLLLLFLREIKKISSKKYKLLTDDVFNVLLKFKNIKYIKFSFTFLLYIFLKFLIFMLKIISNSWKLIFYPLIPFFIIYKAFKFFFFSNYLISIIIRCMVFLYYILALSFYYHKYSPKQSFISDYY